MTVETARKEDLFAALQTRLIGAGVKPLSPEMGGIQTKVQEFAKAWADEAVAAATLCVTEEDISEAVAKWSKELQSTGNMVDAAKLMAAAKVLVEVGERCAEGRAVAVVNLPPEADELPAHLEKRIKEVMTIAFPARREREAMVRLVRALVRDLAGKPRRDREPPVVDRDVHEWLAAYADRLQKSTPFMTWNEAADLATRVTDYIRGGMACTGTVLDQMAEERHLKDSATLLNYIRVLPGPRPDGLPKVPQPVQQPQGRTYLPGDPQERERAQRAQAEAQTRQMQPGASVAAPVFLDRRAAVTRLRMNLSQSQRPVRVAEEYGRRSPGHAVIAAAAYLRFTGLPELSALLLDRTDTVAALQIENPANAVDLEAAEVVAEAVAKAKGWSRGTVAIDGGKVIAGAMLLDAYGFLEQFRECKTWLELCRQLCIPVVTPEAGKEAMPHDPAHEGEDVARPRQDGGSAAAAGAAGGGSGDLGAHTLEAIAEAKRDGGWWASCTGCHETVEGHETGDYPYSEVFACHVGSGCTECGGLGVVWHEFTDEDAAAREAEMSAPTPDLGALSAGATQATTYHATQENLPPYHYQEESNKTCSMAFPVGGPKLPAPTPDLGAQGEPVATDGLVDRFAAALKEKLRRSEAKYGWKNGWLSDGWEGDCQSELVRHVAKGDPLDVAAYAAFSWHHGWLTLLPNHPADDEASRLIREAAELIRTRPAPAAPRTGSAVTVEEIRSVLHDHIELEFRKSEFDPYVQVTGFSEAARAILALFQAPRPGETGQSEPTGDVETLAAFCRRTGGTPSMMEADRDIWRTRAQRAEFVLTAILNVMLIGAPTDAPASDPGGPANMEALCEAAARTRGWVKLPNGDFQNGFTGLTIAPCSWSTLCLHHGIVVHRPQPQQQQQSDHGKGPMAGASFHEIAARNAGWVRLNGTFRNGAKESTALSWESLCREQSIPAYPPGKDPRGPQFETFSGDKVATRGPDAASTVGNRATSLLEANGLHRPTWEAAVKACCDWSADRAGTDSEVADVDAMRREVTFPDA